MSNAQPQMDMFQVSTHPDIDLTPRVSPDGRWVAYVSRQADNYDIWVVSTGGGRSRQITTNTADDFYPVWTPDSKSLVFVSQRQDAAGDIWKIDLREIKGRLFPKGDPKRLTDYIGYDGYPTVSPDNKKIAWVSDRSGRDEIWFYNEHTENTLQLTFLGGTQPCWSPDLQLLAFTSFRDSSANHGDIFIINLKGPKPSTLLWDEREYPTYQVTRGAFIDGFPSWSPDASQLVFLRQQKDTNQDGRLTPADQGVVWALEVYREPQASPESLQGYEIDAESYNPYMISAVHRLTAGGQNCMQPWYGADNRVYMTSDRGGDLDIWSFPATGPIPDFQTASRQYEFAAEYFSLSEQMDPAHIGPLLRGWQPETLSPFERRRLWDRAFAFRKVMHSPVSDTTAQALYQRALCFSLLGRAVEAKQQLDVLYRRYPTHRFEQAFTEMLILGNHYRSADSLDRSEVLETGLRSIIDRFEDQPVAIIEALLQLADFYHDENEFDLAIAAYNRIIEGYTERAKISEAMVKKASIYNELGNQDQAIQIYLDVIINYSDQPVWRTSARDALLAYPIRSEKPVMAFRKMTLEYRDIPFIAASAQYGIAEYLFNQGQVQTALIEFSQVEMQFPAQSDIVFGARMKQAECMIELGAYREAFAYLDTYRAFYEKNETFFADSLKQFQTSAMIKVADELSALNDFELAQTFYSRVIELDPQRLEAHRGLIECYYYQHEIDQVVARYSKLAQENSTDKIILYAYGLALSYQGTEKADLGNDPDGFEPDLLHQSSNVIARALSFDYSMVEPYLTIAYNYEMQEISQSRQEAKPKGFLQRFVETLTAPVVTLYRFFTFYDEKQPARYYERAVHELTKALALNDEHKNPKKEAILAMNLANNYYSLDEFGLEKAYEYYNLKLAYDSTFTNIKREALIYERMGHCALVVEDLEKGPVYLQRAISLYQELNLPLHELKNIKRLALLYEIGQEHHAAVDLYQRAAEMENRLGRYDDLMKSYRNIAYNYFRMGERLDALNYGQQALRLLNSGRVEPVKDKASRIKIGFLGLYFPLPFFDMNKMTAESATSGFTTDDDRAFLFTIMGKSYKELSDFDNAIEYFNQKWRLWQKHDDPGVRATILNYLGYLYYLKGDYRFSWQSFMRSRELCEKNEIYDGLFTNTLNLGILVKSLNAKPHLLADSIQIKTQEWQDTAIELLDHSLDISRDLFGFTRAEIELGIMLSDLLIQQPFLHTRPTAKIHDLGRAHALLQQCLESIQINNDIRLECETEYLLGCVSYELNDKESAYSHFRRGRWLALTNGYTHILWKIDLKLADLADDAQDFNDQSGPFTYLEEAIRVVENDTLYLTGMSSLDAIWSRSQVYNKMITYLLSIRSYRNALDYAERKRARLVLDLFAQERLPLEEPFQTLYDRARVLRTSIYRLKSLILRARYTQESARQVAEWNDKLDSFNQEYMQIQMQIQEQKPRLLPFIRANTVPLEKIQSLLSSDQSIMFIEWIDNVYVWSLFAESIRVDTLDIDLNSFSKESLQRSGFKEIIAKYHDHKHVCLIPPLSHLLAPWRQFFDASESVFLLSSLGAFHDNLANNLSITEKLYSNSTDLPWENHTLIPPVPQVTGNSFDAQVDGMRTASIIALNIQADWNQGAPLHTRFGYSIRRSKAALFSPLEWIKYAIPAYAVHLNFRNALDWRQSGLQWLVWERALIYSGVENIILTHSDFLNQFENLYRDLSDSLWDKDLQFTGESARIFTAGLRLRRSSDQDQESLSPDIFLAEGNRAYNNQDYPLARQYYQQALNIAETQSDREALIASTGKLFKVATCMQSWETAINMQSKLLSIAQKENDLIQASLSLHYLVYFYTLTGDTEKRERTQGQVLALAKSFEVLEQEARVLVNLGSIFQESGQIERSIKAYDRAISWYQNYDRPDQVVELQLELGTVYWQDLQEYYKALELFQTVESNAADEDVILKSILLTGDLWKDLNGWSLALDHYKSLHQRAGGSESPYLLFAEHRLADMYLILGQLERAEYHEKNALDLSDKAAVLAGSDRMVKIRVQQQKYKQAQALIEQRLKILQEGDNAEELSIALNTMALVYGKQGVYPEALRYLRQAIEIDSSRSAMDYYKRDLYHLAVIQVLNNMPEAKQTLDRLFAMDSGFEFKPILLALHHAYNQNDENSFDQLQVQLEILLNENKIANNLRAFYYYYSAMHAKEDNPEKFEQDLIQSLDELVEMNAELYADSYDAFWAPTIRQILNALVLYYDEEEDLEQAWQIAHMAKQWPYRMQMKYHFLDLDTTKNLTSNFKDWLVSAHDTLTLPDHLPNPWQRDVIPLDQLQSSLSPGDLYLDYYVMDDRIFLWIIENNAIELKKISLTDEDIADISKSTPELLIALLDPVDNLNDKETILINPDQWIHRIHFSTYQLNDRSLASQKTLFHVMILDERGLESFPRREDTIAFFSPAGYTRQPLQGFADRLLDYFDRQNMSVKRFWGNQATRTRFLETTAKYIIIDSHHPDSLAVQTSFSFSPDSLTDGYISIGEVLSLLNENSILVVMDQDQSWNDSSLRNLMTAWLWKGGAGVVTIRSKENSYPISLLLKRFLLHINENEPLSQAWSRAQTDLIDLLNLQPTEWQGIHFYYPLVLSEKNN
jgi:Tol biopolymer transport system component/tetratricopeptide (TPR) repeat protein